MKFVLEAACACHRGSVRSKNEDNFYFYGKTLEEENEGLRHPVVMEGPLVQNIGFAVFDGMGGENFGERASYSAAREMQKAEREQDVLMGEKAYLSKLVQRMNNAVVVEEKKLLTSHMGSTLACLYFTNQYVYVCNLGDSRAYRLRNHEFMQISQDHVDARPLHNGGKPAVSQYLGIDPEEVLLDPYIAKGEIKSGDLYLLCSDGLTDMASNFEIADIMLQCEDTADCVRKLIHIALEHGGEDNITAIVCRVR